MVEGPGCKLNGEKMRCKLLNQIVKKIRGSCVSKDGKKKHLTELSPYVRLITCKLQDVLTLGKELFMIFGDLCLRVHFLMSGSIRINNQQQVQKMTKEREELVLEIEFSENILSVYGGSVDLRSTASCLTRYDQLKDVDICSPMFNPKKAAALIKAEQERQICDILLDQQILPGVGNIIKNEALFDSGLRPNSKIRELTDTYISHLVKMTRDFTMIFYKDTSSSVLRLVQYTYLEDAGPPPPMAVPVEDTCTQLLSPTRTIMTIGSIQNKDRQEQNEPGQLSVERISLSSQELCHEPQLATHGNETTSASRPANHIHSSNETQNIHVPSLPPPQQNTLMQTNTAPTAQTNAPHTSHRPSIEKLIEAQFLGLYRYMGEFENRIGKKLNAFSTRITNKEIAQKSFDQKLKDIKGCFLTTAADSSIHIHAEIDSSDDPFASIPHPHYISKEELSKIHKNLLGPGKFARNVYERLYRELFTSENLRQKYSYNSDGIKNKIELDPVKKTYLQKYVLYFEPHLKSNENWKNICVTKINECLRRPVKTKN